ncbi:MAG: DUF4097 family beta strand repeat-containing protein [Bryobacterales bacterium]|nr:DUF4097 family beta strand repeat-containing protein [Bryobacteraceae bacterium]MDW8355242.1 DUF4097 family beta strand repeat-containing protein [Bryobacterales bacterium]
MGKVWLGTAGLVLLAACDLADWAESTRYKEDFHYSYDLKPGGRLYVENFNGSIEIAGWNQDRAEITGTKYASSKDLLAALKVDVVATGDSLRIRTVRPSARRGIMGARYLIRLPRRTSLERIESSNGGIRIENIDGDARLRTSNGSVRVAALGGDLEAETSNGGVELEDVDGKLTVRTSNGGIRGTGVRGPLDAQTSNGAIRVAFQQLHGHRPIRAVTSNGSIELELPELSGGVEASTSNGAITLRLPASISADVRAVTSNSSITSDFDVRVRGRMSKTHVEGAIGSGGPLLDLKTSNGAIRLLKAAVGNQRS